MSLNAALYTGLSGLNVNQTRLNVVGNNIANSNTVAFKSSRALFTPQYYLTDNGGTPASTTFGGNNPDQRGLGATVGTIQKNFNSGSIEPTGRQSDLALDGDGFFVVDNDSRQFTRDGSFTLNSNHDLVAQSGGFVMGYAANSDGTVQTGQLSKITIPLGQSAGAKATSKAGTIGNLSIGSGGASVLNSGNITTVGGGATPTTATLLTNLADAGTNGAALFNVGDVLTVNATKGGTPLAPSSLTVTPATTLADLTAFYNTALGIDANLPGNGTTAPQPGSTIKPGTSTNAIQLVIAGNAGASNALSISPGSQIDFADGTTGDTIPIASNPNGQSVITQFTGYDSIGNPLTINFTAVLDNISPAGAVWKFTATSPSNVGGETAIIGTGTIQFDTNGQFVSSTDSTITLSRDGTGAVTPQTIDLDFSQMSGYGSDPSVARFTTQDGFTPGTLDTYSIGADGSIVGSFSNGRNQVLGQIAVATFRNNEGLSDNGGSFYTATGASGVAVVGTPLQLGAGAVRSGSLELSNVDLSTEFTNLIIASTGFSAASRVITTSDQLIQELLNAAR